MVSRWQRFGALGLAFAAGVLITVVVVAVSRSDPGPSSNAEATPSVPAPASPSPSGELLRIGGVPAAAPVRTLDPTLAPYPFMSPTPPPTETELDGTYLRTLTLRDVGGARVGLPFRCLRCPPYRIDAGVSTIIFTRGAFYLHHQMSGFKTHGSFVVEGDRLILFNDANCPQTRGVYAFEIEPHGVRFDVIHDDCPWSGERADDLMAVQWTHVHACVRWIQNLWPGAVAC